MNINLSIVSLNYNRLKFTQEHIENIFNTVDVDCELILVSNYDGGDASAEVRKYIKSYTNIQKNGCVKRIRRVLNNKNYGVAGGRNSGLVVAKAPFKMVVDDDILLPEKWASKIIYLLNKVDKIGVAGYCVEKEKAAQRYKLKTYNDCVFKNKGKDNIGGACMVIPPRTFKLLGYFNEDYGVFGFEDADYGVRVGALGLLNAYVYPEKAIQQSDTMNTTHYHEWKRDIYKDTTKKALLATNILKYEKGKGLYIGKERLKTKWFDLH